MSDHTLINLRDDVEDAAANFGMSETMEARFPREAIGASRFAISLQRLKPNQRQPFGHPGYLGAVRARRRLGAAGVTSDGPASLR